MASGIQPVRAIVAVVLALSLVPTPARADIGDSSTPDSARRTAPNRTSESPSVQTSLQTGDATYTVPIVVPPGTAGMTPEIALSYSSGDRTDSPVGYGWSLSIPSIRRSLRNGVPTYNNSLDGFELGGQLLVPKPGGAVGEYRTREESFANIQFSSSTNSWTVTRKDGRRLSFGVSASHRIVSSFVSTDTYEWLLESDDDPSGNMISYTWFRETGVAYPDTITYGEGRAIRFTRELRNDQPVSYLPGFPRTLKQRITSIFVEIGSGASAQQVRRYTLIYSYSQDSFRSLLARVSLSGTGGPKVLDTVFSYRSNVADNTVGWESSPISWSVLRPDGSGNSSQNPVVVDNDGINRGVRIVDINGDGLLDVFAARVNAAETNSIAGETGIFLNTGSALRETVPSVANPLSNLTPTYPIPDWSNGTKLGFSRDTARSPPTSAQALDLTGDGRADLLFGRREMLNGQWAPLQKPAWIQSGPSTRFAGAPTYWSHRASLAQAPDLLLSFQNRDQNWEVAGGAVFYGDINGDGRTDLFVSGEEGDGTGQIAFPTLHTLCVRRIAIYYYLSLGELDFVLGAPRDEGVTSPPASSACSSPSIQYSFTQDAYGHPPVIEYPPGIVNPLHATSKVYRTTNSNSLHVESTIPGGFVDLNNDGLDEPYSSFLNPNIIIGEPPERAIAGLNAGLGFLGVEGAVWLPPSAVPGVLAFVNNSWTWTDAALRFADINGDGRVDIVKSWQGPAPGTGDDVITIWLGDGDVDEPGTSGKGFVLQPSGGGWIPPHYFNKAWHDSITDADYSRDSGARIADMTGDGMADFVMFSTVSGTRRHWVYRNRGKVPDLLIQVESPYHGITKISYKPSTTAVDPSVSLFPNADQHDIGFMPFVKQLVASVETDNRFGAIGCRAHDYFDGYFDPDEREFRGFGEVTETRGSGSCATIGTSASERTISVFHQEIELAGLPSIVAVEGRTGSGQPWVRWQTVTTRYKADSTAPYLRLPECVVTSETDAAATEMLTGRKIFYNANGDPTNDTNWGLVVDETCADDPADVPRSIITSYALDSSGRVRNRPSSISVRENFFTQIDYRRLDYDLLPNGQVTQGLLTKDVHVDVDLDDPGAPDPAISPTTTYFYNASGLLADSINPRENAGQVGATGGRTSVLYDASFGDQVATVKGPQVSGQRFQNDTIYVSSGCSVSYPAGAGLPAITIDPNGVETRYCYDELGRPASETMLEPNGAAFIQIARRTWAYVDTLGPLGAASITVTEDVAPGKARSTRTYLDGFGRPILESADGPVSCGAGCTIETAIGYDGLGRKAAETVPRFAGTTAGTTQFFYDPLGRETRRVLPTLNRQILTTRVPDGLGRLMVRTTDPELAIVDRFHDAFGNVREVQQNGGADLTTYAYDAADRVLAIDHLGALTTIDYDGLGRRLSLIDPDAGRTDFVSYDANGNLLQSNGPRTGSPDPDFVTWVYDPLDRPLSRSIDSTSWTYDGVGVTNGVPNSLGRVTKIARTAAGFTTEIQEYDGLGNPTWEKFTQGGRIFQFTSAYDQLGQLVQRAYPSASSRILTWATDTRGYVTDVTTSGTSYATGVTWDPLLRLRGWQSGPPGVLTTNTFDSVTGRLSQVSIGSLEQLNFTYWNDDLVKDITGGQDGNRSFKYDGMKRLVEATGPFGDQRTVVTRCYAYDDLGNLARMDGTGTAAACTSGGRAFTYGANNAARPHGPTAIDGNSTAYDPAGNLTSAFGRTYGYDNLNRLLSVTQGSTLGSFGYGGDDRLVSITGGGKTKIRPTDDFEWTQGDNLARVYVHLGSQVIAVHEESYNPPGTGSPPPSCAMAPLSVPPRSGLFLFVLYVFAFALLYVGLRLPRRRRAKAIVAVGTALAFLLVFTVPPGLAPADAQATPAGVVYYHQDHLGSTTVVTGGPTQGRLVYAPFGATVPKTGQLGTAPDVGFTGQRFEAPVGLYDYGARWYHPDLGHFLTPDALVPDGHDSQSLNRYAYVRNNPVNKVDPTGNDDVFAIANPPGTPAFDREMQRRGLAGEYGFGTLFAPLALPFQLGSLWKDVGGDPVAFGTALGEGFVQGIHHKVDLIGRAAGPGQLTERESFELSADVVTIGGGIALGGLSATAKAGTFSGQAAKEASRFYDDAVQAAQKLYPGKAGKIEQHHVTPKYLGGDPKGPAVPLDAAYHQQITNEFRRLHPYGSEAPSPEQVGRIMEQVYERFPLPPAF